MFDALFVLGERLGCLLLNILVRTETFLVGRCHLVDKFLQFDRVALDLGEVGGVAEGNVFETVDFAELPEDRTFVGAETLDLEDLAEVHMLRNGLDHVVE